MQGKLPPEEAQGALANAQGALGAVGGTLGGTLKGVVDTTSNTVGTLAQGLQGTVQGVGDGLGSTVQFAGGAVGAGVSQVGSYVTGAKGKGDSGPDTTSAADLENPVTKPEVTVGDKADTATQTGKNVLPDAYKPNESSTQNLSESSKEVKESS